MFSRSGDCTVVVPRSRCDNNDSDTEFRHRVRHGRRQPFWLSRIPLAVRSSLTAVLGLALALAGPAAVAFVRHYAADLAPAFAVHVLSLASIILIVLAVFTLAWRAEGF